MTGETKYKTIEVDLEHNDLTLVANPTGGYIFINGREIRMVKDVEFSGGINKKAMLKLKVNEAALDIALIDEKILK